MTTGAGPGVLRVSGGHVATPHPPLEDKEGNVIVAYTPTRLICSTPCASCKIGWVGSFVLFVNTIIGPGILAIPWCYATSGFWPSTLGKAHAVSKSMQNLAMAAGGGGGAARATPERAGSRGRAREPMGAHGWLRRPPVPAAHWCRAAWAARSCRHRKTRSCRACAAARGCARRAP